MSIGKLDLDGLLKDWPAPSTSDDAAWDERADLTVEAAVARRFEEKASLGALLDAPPLAPEPGEVPVDAEPQPTPAAKTTHLHALPGGEERMMSQGSDQEGDRKSSMGVPSDRKRPSLKEIAARASQSSLSTPPSGRTSAVPMSLPSPSSVPVSLRIGPPPSVRPSEAGKEDSGIIDLKGVNAAATPEQEAAAARAQPGTEELGFDEDNKAGDAPPAATGAKGEQPSATPLDATEAKKEPRAATPLAAPKKKGSGGIAAGVAIAVVGLAASFAVMQTRKPPQDLHAAREAPAAALDPQPQLNPQPQPEQAAPVPPPAAAPTEPPATEQAAGGAPKPAEEGKLAMAGPIGAAAPAPASPSAAMAAEVRAAQGKLTAPAELDKPGDLSQAMQKAVGEDGNKSTVTEAPEPAAGKSLNQTIPEQPPQGSLQAAIGSVMGAAKACVAGASDVSRAQVTFSSSGSVSNVSVTGWAASNGASGCIKTALQGANVGAFSKPTYTFGLTIRP